MLGPHVRYLRNFNLLAQLVVSLLHPFDFFIKNLELLLLLFDIILWIVDAEIVGVNACFDLCDLIELLRHGVPNIQFAIQLREICIESFEYGWLGILRWLRLDDEFFEPLEACIIEFVLPSIIQSATECFRLQKVCLMEVLVVFWSRFSFVYDHDDDIEQRLFGLWQLRHGNSLSNIALSESRDVIQDFIQSCILIFQDLVYFISLVLQLQFEIINLRLSVGDGHLFVLHWLIDSIDLVLDHSHLIVDVVWSQMQVFLL